jgi:hypothetical protein
VGQRGRAWATPLPPTWQRACACPRTVADPECSSVGGAPTRRVASLVVCGVGVAVAAGVGVSKTVVVGVKNSDVSVCRIGGGAAIVGRPGGGGGIPGCPARTRSAMTRARAAATASVSAACASGTVSASRDRVAAWASTRSAAWRRAGSNRRMACAVAASSLVINASSTKGAAPGPPTPDVAAL